MKKMLIAVLLMWCTSHASASEAVKERLIGYAMGCLNSVGVSVMTNESAKNMTAEDIREVFGLYSRGCAKSNTDFNSKGHLTTAEFDEYRAEFRRFSNIVLGVILDSWVANGGRK